jgi:mRNA interferase RelE/StbE
MIVLLHHVAGKYLNRLNAADRNRIKEALHNLAKEPPEGDIKPYEGNSGILRLRVGSFRIIFRFENNNTILVSHIEPRGQAYTKKTKTKRGSK